MVFLVMAMWGNLDMVADYRQDRLEVKVLMLVLFFFTLKVISWLRILHQKPWDLTWCCTRWIVPHVIVLTYLKILDLSIWWKWRQRQTFFPMLRTSETIPTYSSGVMSEASALPWVGDGGDVAW